MNWLLMVYLYTTWADWDGLVVRNEAKGVNWLFMVYLYTTWADWDGLVVR